MQQVISFFQCLCYTSYILQTVHICSILPYFTQGERMQLEGLQIGRYHLIRLIGSGGVGQVYLAKDTQLLIGREVAVKVITPPDDQEEARIVIDLFIREVKAISRLNHPHILPLSDYGTATLYGIMRAYLVMPHSKEGSLAEWMKQPSNA